MISTAWPPTTTVDHLARVLVVVSRESTAASQETGLSSLKVARFLDLACDATYARMLLQDGSSHELLVPSKVTAQISELPALYAVLVDHAAGGVAFEVLEAVSAVAGVLEEVNQLGLLAGRP